MDDTLNDLRQITIDTVRLYGFIKNIVGKNNKAVSEIIKNNPDQPFIFTGQITDLSYFQNNEVMPISAISEIEDETLKQSVKSTFENASKSNLVSIDNESGTISLTKKGKKYINKESFVKQAKKDQLKAFKEKLESLKNQANAAKASAKTASTGAKASASKAVTKVSKVAAAASMATKVLKRD